jgi:ankyrin repeat protein
MESPMNQGDFLAFPDQRWVRPFNFPPGHWKKQLAGKYLEIASRGDLIGLRRLLADHPEFLNKRGPHGRTFLWEATRRGKYSTVQWLIEQGAQIDLTGAYNQESYVQITPYCAALYYGHTEIADYLLAHGAQLDIFRAAFIGDVKAVTSQLDASPELLNAEDSQDPIYYVPLLAYAVAGGHVPTVELLLKRGADVEQYSAQLISIATMSSRLDLIELLVSYNARVDALDTGTFVLTPDLQIMQYLLNHGASASQPGRSGFPPLVYLSRGDKGEHVDKLQLLLDHGADVNATDPKERTALHYAAKAGFLNVIQLLLDHGADASLRDDEGQTPLVIALAAGKSAVANLLSSHSTTK